MLNVFFSFECPDLCSCCPSLLQDDSAAHSEHQDPISLAVEMAAVNHSILALSRTGGVPNDIKTESLEDEWTPTGPGREEGDESGGEKEAGKKWGAKKRDENNAT